MASADTSMSAMGPLPTAGLVDTCWGVPVLTALASFLLSIPELNAGVFYVLFIDEMGASREEASWPKSIILATTQLTGLVVGAIQHKVPILAVLLVGASLSPVSIIASAFVPNMTWISVTFGFFYGAFRGLLQIATSVYLVTYFDQYRSVAIGFTSAIGTLAGVAGPSLLMLLASAYGLKGTLLLSGGLMLNLIPFTLMLRNPRPISWSACRHCSTMKQQAKETTRFAQSTRVVPVSHKIGDNFCRSREDEAMGVVTKQGVPKEVGARKVPPVFAPRTEPLSPRPENTCPDMSGNNKAILSQTLSLLRKPCFYVLIVAVLAADFTCPVLGSTIADYGRDKGLPAEDAEHLLTLLSLGGVFGHVIIPFVGDKLQCARSALTALACVIFAVCFVIIPHVDGFASMCAVTFVGGLQFGYLITMKPVLVADYLGVRFLAICLGLMGALSLPLIFAEPSILGIFRDTGGSYDNLYRTCGGINLFAALLLSAQACFDARKTRSWKMYT